MSCKEFWAAQIAGPLAGESRVAPGQVDGGQRCDHEGCDALVNQAINRCLRGHAQQPGGRPTGDLDQAWVVEALRCVIRHTQNAPGEAAALARQFQVGDDVVLARPRHADYVDMAGRVKRVYKTGPRKGQVAVRLANGEVYDSWPSGLDLVEVGATGVTTKLDARSPETIPRLLELLAARDPQGVWHDDPRVRGARAWYLEHVREKAVEELNNRIGQGRVASARQADEAAAEIAGEYFPDSNAAEYFDLLGTLCDEAGTAFPGEWGGLEGAAAVRSPEEYQGDAEDAEDKEAW